MQTQPQGITPQDAMEIVNKLKNSQNPLDLLEVMSKNNPNLQNAVSALKESGGNPEQAVMSLLVQNRGGMDLKALQNMYYGK